jgi:hypothetical protein
MQQSTIIDDDREIFEYIDHYILIDINLQLLLFVRWIKVRFTISSGKAICHQKLISTEYPPALLRKLSPNAVAVGVRGVRSAIGIAQLILESELNCFRKIQSPVSLYY